MENRFGTFGDNDSAKGTIFNERISEIGNELILEYNDHAKDYTLQVPYAGTTTGTVNTYAIASPTITALPVGQAVSVKFNEDSTGASTLNWCGLGAKPIKKANGTSVTNLKATGIYTLRYDGTNFILQGEGASGDATASDLISGKTATVDAGEITGTLTCTGDAVATDVYTGKKFYNTDPKNLVTGTLALTGTAAVGDVVSGKTFYNTDAKTKLTGTYSNIKSVQRGYVNLLNLAQQDVSISSVNLNNSIVIVSEIMGEGQIDSIGKVLVSGGFLSQTSIRIKRGVAMGTYAQLVYWTVIEFNNVKSIQSGEVALTTPTTNMTVNSVNLEKSILFSHVWSTEPSQYFVNNARVGVSLTSQINIEASGYSPQSYGVRVVWRLIEFN